MLQACHGFLAELFPAAASPGGPALVRAPGASGAGGDPAALAQDRYREDNEVMCAAATGFLGDDPLERIVMLRIILEPFRELKASLLDQGSIAWQLREAAAAAANGGERRHPISMSWSAAPPKRAMTEIAQLWCEPAPWQALQPRVRTNRAWSNMAFRALSRAGGAVLELLIAEQQVYPYKLFQVLADPTSAVSVLADRGSCGLILDDFSKAHLDDHPEALGLLSQISLRNLRQLHDRSPHRLQRWNADTQQ